MEEWNHSLFLSVCSFIFLISSKLLLIRTILAFLNNFVKIILINVSCFVIWYNRCFFFFCLPLYFVKCKFFILQVCMFFFFKWLEALPTAHWVFFMNVEITFWWTGLSAHIDVKSQFETSVCCCYSQECPLKTNRSRSGLFSSWKLYHPKEGREIL